MIFRKLFKKLFKRYSSSDHKESEYLESRYKPSNPVNIMDIIRQDTLASSAREYREPLFPVKSPPPPLPASDYGTKNVDKSMLSNS